MSATDRAEAQKLVDAALAIAQAIARCPAPLRPLVGDLLDAQMLAVGVMLERVEALEADNIRGRPDALAALHMAVDVTRELAGLPRLVRSPPAPVLDPLPEAAPASPGPTAYFLTPAANATVGCCVVELGRAMRKFPTWPTDPLHAVAVLNEEVGELNKAILQATYEPEKANMLDVGDEAFQTAAMALRFAINLDRYRYARGPQHGDGD